MSAARWLKLSSQTVPQTPSWNTSTRPLDSLSPSISRNARNIKKSSLLSDDNLCFCVANVLCCTIPDLKWNLSHLYIMSPWYCYDLEPLSARYSDVIMSAMATLITGVTIVYTTVCSGTHQRKHQSSVSLALIRRTPSWRNSRVCGDLIGPNVRLTSLLSYPADRIKCSVYMRAMRYFREFTTNQRWNNLPAMNEQAC